MIRSDEITIVTDAAGAFVGSTQDFVGLLEALIYVPGTIVTGADLAVVDPVSGVALWAATDAGTAVLHKLPRAPTVDVANAASLYAAGGEPVEGRYAIVGRVQITVAQGGDTFTGKLYVVWDGG